MPILKPQHYTPLDKHELKEVEKALKGSSLLVRVISQLRQQDHYLELQRAHFNAIHRNYADDLRDIADAYEVLENEVQELRNNQ